MASTSGREVSFILWGEPQAWGWGGERREVDADSPHVGHADLVASGPWSSMCQAQS